MGCKKSYALLRIACLIGVRLLVPPRCGDLIWQRALRSNF